MKKLLLLLLSSTAINAQALLTEDCSFLTVGNVGTALTGLVAGQGDWLTFISSTAVPVGTNADFQVVDKGGVYGNAFQINGPSATTGTRFLFKDIASDWANRTVGNEILEVEYDFFTGPTSTSRNQFAVYIYSDEATPKVIFGFNFAKNTAVGATAYPNLIRGLAHYTNTATPPVTGLFNFGLGTVAPFQISTTDNTWIKIGLSFNKTTGEVKWRVPSLNINGFVIGAAIGLNPGEIDIIGATGSTTAIPNASAAIGVFDNLAVRASSSDTLLAVKSIEANTTNFSISPNPANDFVTISSKNSAINKIDLTDINGRIVKTVNVGDLTETTVNISNLASGVYMIKIASAEGVATKKIIKN